eukprot:364447-Chlamydomonas_euryale.AAC.23
MPPASTASIAISGHLLSALHARLGFACIMMHANCSMPAKQGCIRRMPQGMHTVVHGFCDALAEPVARPLHDGCSLSGWNIWPTPCGLPRTLQPSTLTNRPYLLACDHRVVMPNSMNNTNHQLSVRAPYPPRTPWPVLVPAGLRTAHSCFSSLLVNPASPAV